MNPWRMERLSPAAEIELAMQMSTPYASDSILLSPPSVTQHTVCSSHEMVDDQTSKF